MLINHNLLGVSGDSWWMTASYDCATKLKRFFFCKKLKQKLEKHTGISVAFTCRFDHGSRTKREKKTNKNGNGLLGK